MLPQGAHWKSLHNSPYIFVVNHTMCLQLFLLHSFLVKRGMNKKRGCIKTRFITNWSDETGALDWLLDLDLPLNISTWKSCIDLSLINILTWNKVAIRLKSENLYRAVNIVKTSKGKVVKNEIYKKKGTSGITGVENSKGSWPWSITK